MSLESSKISNKLVSLSNFIHRAQEERYKISIYLNSDKSSYDDLLKQFKIVDKIAQDLSELFDDFKEDAKISYFLKSLSEIANKRQEVIDRSIALVEIALFYSREIIAPAIDIISELMIFNFEDNYEKVGAYVNFLQLKERVGLQRAMGAILIVGNNFDDKTLLSQLCFLVLKQESYKKITLSLMDETQKSIFSKNNIGDAIQEIADINQIIASQDFTQIGKIISKISLQKWLEIFNAKMDLLHKIELQLIDNICQNNIYDDKIEKDQTPNFYGSDKVTQYLSLISNLPIFINLKEAELQEILKYAHINKCKKGSLLFSEGELASRFYIVLEGWVKIFRGNMEGEESVIQMIGPGKSIAETAMLLSSSFPANAQMASDAKILSIPVAIIRESIKKNRNLANNMLATMANQSKNLINQLGQLTLKTAKERVGWFLLSLFLEDSKKKHSICLPYDKSLVASYLGMKPETFSRVLQALKDEGELEIERNNITLSDDFSLCQYCDHNSDLAAKCEHRDSNECLNNEL